MTKKDMFSKLAIQVTQNWVDKENSYFLTIRDSKKIVFAINAVGNIIYHVNGKEKICTTQKELAKQMGSALILMAQMADEKIFLTK